jgi:hypothetical protein
MEMLLFNKGSASASSSGTALTTDAPPTKQVKDAPKGIYISIHISIDIYSSNHLSI